MELNAYFWIILIALTLHFALERLSAWLTLRRLSPEVPPEFAPVCPPERYARMQAYTRDRIRFSTVVACWDFAMLLAFWLAGGFALWERVVGGWFSHPVPAGLAFIGGLVAASSVPGLPFEWYATFVLDARYDLNRTTPRTFVLDRLKGLVLGVVLGGGLLAALIAFFLWTGDAAWLWAFGFFFLVSLFLQYLAPVLLLPLFNRFWPLPEGELGEGLKALARRTGFPLREVFVMDGSRRSARSNAFFTGFGSKKRIVLFDTLLEKHEPGEILAITAHEIGHYKRHHILIGTVLAQVQAVALLFLLSRFVTSTPLFTAFGVPEPSFHVGLVLFGLLLTPLQLVLSLLGNALSRRHERQADRFAAEAMGGGAELASALRKLSMDNLSNLTPHPLSVVLHASHPPTLERIRSLEPEMARSSQG
ncbi:M48 family metallopeptidase [Myxococcota bacterium]|nr:M48 family metallopeptidase [Myxococcota bacterium]MBU1413471.1 M48 family metallopeptidase [Myxococcota bacterium]MBU1509043.1 M48 family metallopeptidase [Myxococcota bacterium]